MATSPTHNPISLERQYEGARLALAAYAAQSLKSLLATSPTASELAAGTVSALVAQGFTPAQAEQFAHKYTPVSALDQDGAGAVLFRVNGTSEIAVGVRGTETPSDLFGADVTIATNRLPQYQTTLIANWVLRETTPADQTVAQFDLKGFNSNWGEATSAVLFDGLKKANPFAAVAVQLASAGQPIVQVNGQVQGTGLAVGTCVDAAAHSEGSPEVTVIGSALAQCQRITTVNGAGVRVERMQKMANAFSISALALAQTAAPGNGNGVNFAWDGQGYQRATGWVAANDGLLVLNQNFNQSVDNGTEFLSNALIADIGCTNARMQPMNTGYALILSDTGHDPERCWRGAARQFNTTATDVPMEAQA